MTNHTTANVEKQFQGSGRAQVSPDRNYVIVVSGSDYPWPRNALVFNSDGSLRRVVEPPDYIEHITFSGQLRKFKPEGFRSVHIKDGRVVLRIFFNHDWYQERFFDPATGIWGDVVVSGRH